MNKIKIILALLLTGFLNTGYASSYVFDFSYNGSSVTVNQNAYGQNLSVGDSITATFNATGGYWQTGGYLWPLIGINESGTRIGDETYNFYANNVLVDTHSILNGGSSFVHVIQGYNATAGLNFDKLVVNYVLNSSTSAANTFSNAWESMGGSLSGINFVVGELPQQSAVPVPAAVWLFASGLLGLFGVKRKTTAIAA